MIFGYADLNAAYIAQKHRDATLFAIAAPAQQHPFFTTLSEALGCKVEWVGNVVNLSECKLTDSDLWMALEDHARKYRVYSTRYMCSVPVRGDHTAQVWFRK